MNGIRRRTSAIIAGWLVLTLLTFVQRPADAAATLTIGSVSWNVIGLDSNDVTTGPNRFLIGARVCNTGDTAATGVTTTFVWDSANAGIQLVGPATVTDPTLAAGACTDPYFLVTVARDPALYDTTRAYHIETSADGVAAVSTPVTDLYVEHLISQNRNDAISITGPTTVYVGGTYTYTATSSTAPQGYEQLSTFLDWPTSTFRILDVDMSLSAPPARLDTTYADACGWDPVTRTCTGTGKAGGDIVTEYTVRVIGTGTATLRNLIYDFSGSSYHYNADYSADDPGSTAITITALAPAPDLAVDKAATGDLVAGSQGTYILTVSNVGPQPTTGPITVTDELPAGLTPVAAEGSGWSCSESGATVTCTSPGPIAAGDSSTITLTVDVAADAPASVTNVVTVSTPGDQVPGNDTDTEVTPVRRPALTIDKSADPAEGSEVRPGATIAYTVVVSNTGDAAATGVVLTDPLPAGLTATAATLNGAPVDPADVEGGLALPDLAPGAVHTLVLETTVTPAAPDEVVNVATVTSDSTDPVSDTVRHPVASRPGLTLEKSASASEVAVGDTVTYTLVVTSTGPDTALDVTVTDPVPDGTSYVAGSTRVDGASVPDAAGGSPLADGLALGDLASGRVVTVTFDVSPTAGGVIVNSAAVDEGEGRTDPAGAEDQVAITVAQPGGVLPDTGPEERPWATFWAAVVSILAGSVLLEAAAVARSRRPA